ncbi:hypothetical protein Nepgr_033069 [Nepenthes gracilis]|uniref:Uncharacterized protein n=1 Tax=Nepenthes gracilis TaxID=150966 RepID=A0AAD3TLC2_NEPGR|nr:hypothetical protein Nepgr_033069 [Nepenthes gracilis]
MTMKVHDLLPTGAPHSSLLIPAKLNLPALCPFYALSLSRPSSFHRSATVFLVIWSIDVTLRVLKNSPRVRKREALREL